MNRAMTSSSSTPDDAAARILRLERDLRRTQSALEDLTTLTRARRATQALAANREGVVAARIAAFLERHPGRHTVDGLLAGLGLPRLYRPTLAKHLTDLAARAQVDRVERGVYAARHEVAPSGKGLQRAIVHFLAKFPGPRGINEIAEGVAAPPYLNGIVLWTLTSLADARAITRVNPGVYASALPQVPATPAVDLDDVLEDVLVRAYETLARHPNGMRSDLLRAALDVPLLVYRQAMEEGVRDGQLVFEGEGRGRRCRLTSVAPCAAAAGPAPVHGGVQAAAPVPRARRTPSAAVDQLLARACALLSQHPNGMRSGHLRAVLGVEPGAYRRAMDEGVREGRVLREGKRRETRYRLARAGASLEVSAVEGMLSQVEATARIPRGPAAAPVDARTRVTAREDAPVGAAAVHPSPVALAATVDDLLARAYERLAQHRNGMRSEHLRAALGVEPIAYRRAMKQGVRAGRLLCEGEGRGRRYRLATSTARADAGDTARTRVRSHSSG